MLNQCYDIDINRLCLMYSMILFYFVAHPKYKFYFVGLRKVYPYFYAFSTFVKGRWFHRTLCDIFSKEFSLAKEYNVVRTLL